MHIKNKISFSILGLGRVIDKRVFHMFKNEIKTLNTLPRVWESCICLLFPHYYYKTLQANIYIYICYRTKIIEIRKKGNM